MDAILQYAPIAFTVLFFVSILIGALIGMFQGFFKSIYFTIVTVIVLVGGYFLIPVIANKLIDVNMNFLPSFGFGEATTIKGLIREILVNQFPDVAPMLVEGSDLMAFITGVAVFAITIVLFIVLIILNATLFKLIAWIIWLIIKPKLSENDQRMGRKLKKHRLFGAIVGGVKAFILLFIFAVPLAGVISIAENAVALMPLLDDSTAAHTQNSELELVEEIVGSYRGSVMGIVYGIPMGEARFDEHVFDTIFTINVKFESGKKEKIKLRKEINSLTNIADVLLKANDYKLEFNLGFFFKLTEDDITVINKNLKNLRILNVAKNIGAEYLYYDMLQDEQVLEAYEEILTLQALKDIDLTEDLTKIISALGVIVTSEAQEEALENVFALTQEEATLVFEHLSSTGLVKYGLTIAVNVLLTSEDIDLLLDEFNIDKEDIFVPTPEELIADFKNIVNFYVLAKDIGFTDQEDIINIVDNIVIIDDEHIGDLFRIVFDFTFILNNNELFASMVYDAVIRDLPDEYRNFLTQQRIKDNFNADELTHLGIIAKMLIESDAMGDDFESSELFSDPNIEKLATHISKSNLLSEGMEHFIAIFINPDQFGFNIIIPDGITFKGAAGKQEIISLLKATRDILDLDFDDGIQTLSGLSPEKIDSMSENISGSKIIVHNLSAIIGSMSSGLGVDFGDVLEDEDPEEYWTKEEIENTLLGFQLMIGADEDFEKLFELSNEEIRQVALSKTISNAFGSMLEDGVEPGGRFDGVLVLPDEEMVYYTVINVDETVDVGELENFLIGLKELLEDGSSIQNLMFDIQALQNTNVELIFESQILETTAVEGKIKPIFDTTLEKYLRKDYKDGTDFDWYQNENPLNPRGDTMVFIDSFKVFDSLNVDFEGIDYNVMTHLLETEENVSLIHDALIESNIFRASLHKMLNEMLVVEGNLDVTVEDPVDLTYWADGLLKDDPNNERELFYILDALTIGKDFKDVEFETLDNVAVVAFRENAKKINRSDTLRSLLVVMLDEEPLDKIDEYRMDNTNPNYVEPKDLTQADWNHEIDTLTDIMLILNGGFDPDTYNPLLATPEEQQTFIDLVNAMNDSKLYDSAKLYAKLGIPAP